MSKRPVEDPGTGLVPTTPKRKRSRPPRNQRAYCKAHSRSGNPCRLSPIKSGNVCHKPGGSAPQVRRKAQERLNNAADRMTTLLLKLATSAESEQVRLAAIKDALDRAGLTAKQALEIEIKPRQRMIEGIVTEDPDETPDKAYRVLTGEHHLTIDGEVASGYDDEDQAGVTYGLGR